MRDPLGWLSDDPGQHPADPLGWLSASEASPEMSEQHGRVPQNRGFTGEFAQGVPRGWHQTKSALYGAGALVSSALGLDETRDSFIKKAQEADSKARQYQPGTSSFADVEDISDLPGFIGGLLGEQVTNMGETAITTLAGSIIGSVMGPAGTAAGATGGILAKATIKNMMASIAKGLTKQGVEKGLAKQMAEDALTKVTMKDVYRAIGAKAGMVAGTFPLEAGGNYLEAFQKGYDNPWSAAATGGAAALLELAGGGANVINALFDPAKGAIGPRRAAKILGQALGWIGKTQAQEGGQEFAQEFLSILNEKINDPKGVTIADKENLARMLDAAVSGGVVGGVYGGAGAGLTAIAPNKVSAAAKRDDTIRWYLQNTRERFMNPEDPYDVPQLSQDLNKLVDITGGAFSGQDRLEEVRRMVQARPPRTKDDVAAKVDSIKQDDTIPEEEKKKRIIDLMSLAMDLPEEGKTRAPTVDDEYRASAKAIQDAYDQLAQMRKDVEAETGLAVAPEDINAAAQEAATSSENQLPEPTEGQIEAGNYKKGHISLHGLDISVENPKGSTRSGTSTEGKKWETTMKAHYGYIKGTVGKDKDHIDTFIGENPNSVQVFVVDQVNPKTGKFDEHKVMLGYDSEEAARTGYLENYEKGWKGLGSMTPMTIDEFKSWLKEGDTTKPVKEVIANEQGQVQAKGTEGQVAKPQSKKEKETKPKSLLRIVQEHGGLDRKATQAGYQDTEGLKSIAFAFANKREKGPGIMDPGDLATELQGLGLLGPTPDTVSGPGEWLIQQLLDERRRKRDNITEDKQDELERAAEQDLANDLRAEGKSESEIAEILGTVREDRTNEPSEEVLKAAAERERELQQLLDEVIVSEEEDEESDIKTLETKETEKGTAFLRKGKAQESTISVPDKEIASIIAQAKADGTYMKGPNGNPTLLPNEHLWALVRTQAFKRWFGDSKVLDANGEPLVVYHGSYADIDVFSPHRPTEVYTLDGKEIERADSWDMGKEYDQKPEAYHYGALTDVLTMGPEEALRYREQEDEHHKQWLAERGEKYTQSAGTRRYMADLKRLAKGKLEARWESRAKDEGSWFTPSMNYSFISSQLGDRAVYPVFLSIKNPVYVSMAEIESAGREWKKQEYIDKGYDGAIYQSNKRDMTKEGWSGPTQIVAFSPTQIKSVFNQGPFNPEDERISYRVTPSDLPDLPTGKMTVASVREAIATITRKLKNIGRVEVIQSVNDLPVDLAERSGAFESAQKGEDVYGIYDQKTDTTYLIADYLANPKAAQIVLTHEIVGHRGVFHLLNETETNLLTKWALEEYKDSDLLAEIVTNYELDLNKASDRQTAALELVAHMAEMTERPTLWQKVVRLFKLALARLGLGSYKESDIERLIRASWRYAEKGRISGSALAGEPSFRKVPLSPDNIERAIQWHLNRAQQEFDAAKEMRNRFYRPRSISDFRNYRTVRGEYDKKDAEQAYEKAKQRLDIAKQLSDALEEYGPQEVYDQVKEALPGWRTNLEETVNYLENGKNKEVFFKKIMPSKQGPGKPTKTTPEVKPEGGKRLFYRGTNPENTNRIDSPFAKGKLFVSSDRTKAKAYGRNIEVIEAKPSAKILYEGSYEFAKTFGKRSVLGNLRKGESYPDGLQRAVDAAEARGYDAVHFERQGDVGTVILNEKEFIRTPTRQEAQPEGGIDFEIYNPRKWEDSFYHTDMGKKGGYRIHDKQGNDWAIYDLSGKRVGNYPGVGEEKLTQWDNVIKKAANSWLNALPDKIYIRFGNLPESGKSEHWQSSIKEKGVSVYTGAKNITTDSVVFNEQAGRDGYPEIPVAARVSAEQGRPIYIVTGKKVGYGSDNEPVLRDVKIITRVVYDKRGFILPESLPNPSRPPGEGGQTPMLRRGPLFTKERFHEEVQDIAAIIKEKTGEPLTFAERMLKSPEWFDHPVFKDLVKIFTRTRNELYHGYFNTFVGSGDEDAVNALVNLRNKGLMLRDRLTGKTSNEYKLLEQMTDEADRNNIKADRAEELWKERNYPEEVIRAWRTVRASYDRQLDAMIQPMLEYLRELADTSFTLDKETPTRGWYYTAPKENFDRFVTVTPDKAEGRGLISEPGVNYIMGAKGEERGGKYTVQAISFDMNVWTKERAAQWFADHVADFPITPTNMNYELMKTLQGAIVAMNAWRGSYAPRIRPEGEWAVVGTRGEGDERERFRTHGSHRQMLKLSRDMEKEGWNSKVERVERLPESIYQDIKVAAVANAIDNAIQEVQGADTFRATILQNTADMIRARGYRSSMIHRKSGAVVSGYITDPMERFLRYTNNNAGGLSKADAARMASEVLLGKYIPAERDEEGNITQPAGREGGINPAKEPRLWESATEYVKEQLRNVERSDRIVALAKSIATFKYLGLNPRSMVVNMTALVTTAPPAILQYGTGGKASFIEVVRELPKAMKDYVEFMAGRTIDDADAQAFLEEAKKAGDTDPQLVRDATGQLHGVMHKGARKAMDVAMIGFQKTEELNRGATMLAAYSLAKKHGFSEEEAREMAKDASDKAHGVYGKGTLPLWAIGSNPAAKIGQMLYVYGKFGHNYVQMLYDLGFKKRNIKAAVWAFAAPMVLAGATAMPFREELFAILQAMLKALGYTGNVERDTWAAVRKHLGSTTEKAVRYGITGQLGVDITGSLSVGVGIPRGLWDLTGAPGAVWDDLATAYHMASRGKPIRAAEKVLPSGLANIPKAFREKTEGITTEQGRRVWTEEGRAYIPSATETWLRLAGFGSSDEGVVKSRSYEAKKAEMAFKDRKDAIYEELRAYYVNPRRTPSDYQDIVKKIVAYNKAARDSGLGKHEVAMITPDSIRRQRLNVTRPQKKEVERLRESRM